MTGQFKAVASVLPGRSRQRFVNFRFLLVACFTGLTVTFHGLDIRSASDTFAIPWQLRVFVAEAAVKRKRVLHAVRDPVTGKVIYPDKKLLSDNTKTAGSPASYAPPIPQLDKASFSSFLDERGQVLVYFYGDERCAKCKATGPEIEDINRGLVKYFFSTSLAQVDVSKHPELAEDQDVTQVPALVFYAEGSKSVPEQYRGKLRANRVFDWLRRQDGSFYRDLAAVRRQQKAPMSVDDEERILKKAAANSPFTTVISYTVPGSPKDKLIKAIAHEGDAMRGTLFHFIPVADFKKSKIEIYKAKLPYDLYEDEDIIDYAAQKWSKNEIKRSIYAAFDRTIYPDTDEYVDNLAKTKALATILHDDKTSDYQEYVDVLLQYARDLKDKLVFTFANQRDAKEVVQFMGFDPGWPTLMITETAAEGRKNVLKAGTYTFAAGPKKFVLKGPFNWGAFDQFFENFTNKRLPAAFRSNLPPVRSAEHEEAAIQDMCHYSLKSALRGLGKWIFVLYYDETGCSACVEAMKVFVTVGKRVRKWTVKDIILARYPSDLNDPIDPAGTLPQPMLIAYPPDGDKLQKHIVYDGEFTEDLVVEFMKGEIRKRWKRAEL
uniref:Protein disulfide isomerase, putative n=8 Tax=Toxoplasma gondii TaxID=5811 RepID=A0A0F7VEX8_TOXGV|nr:TPA: protein disulfide isomerase, putative [Toxoplasma gondii VEG]